MVWVLGIATLVGGVAGIIYLYEKWSDKEVNEPKPILVDFNYPETSGLQQRLNKQGYNIRWSRPDNVNSRMSKGWEIVIDEVEGHARSFKLNDESVLIKIKIE